MGFGWKKDAAAHLYAPVAGESLYSERQQEMDWKLNAKLCRKNMRASNSSWKRGRCGGAHSMQAGMKRQACLLGHAVSIFLFA
jgi:hypothetical protein